MKSLQNYIERKYRPKEQLRKEIAKKTSELEKQSGQLESGVNKIKQLKDSDASISAEIVQLKTAINDLDKKSSERTSEDLHRESNQGQKTRKQLQSISQKLHHENTQLESHLRSVQKKYQDVQMQYEMRQRKYQSNIASTLNFSESTAELTERIQDAGCQLTALSRNLRKPARGTFFESQLLQSPVDTIRAQLRAFDSSIYDSTSPPTLYYQPKQSSPEGHGSSEKRSMDLRSSEKSRSGINL